MNAAIEELIHTAFRIAVMFLFLLLLIVILLRILGEGVLSDILSLTFG